MGTIKTCSNCGTENDPQAKFCKKCGNKLLQAQALYCTACGTENAKDARFCMNCGEALGENPVQRKKSGSPKKKRPQSAKKAPPPPPVSMKVLKIGALLFVLLIVYMLLPERKQAYTVPPQNAVQPLALIEQKSNDPRLEAAVLEIASRFICSCGTCGEQPLNTCTCEVAVAERQFIRAGLQAQKDEETMIRLVNEKYGWIKPEYQEKYGAGKSRPLLEKRLPATPGLSILDDNGTVVQATAADRLAIISSFACTCGQCGIDELKDCNCNHPGGAQEVKAFIDRKISEGKYTRENIVDIVDARYGNRIR